ERPDQPSSTLDSKRPALLSNGGGTLDGQRRLGHEAIVAHHPRRHVPGKPWTGAIQSSGPGIPSMRRDPGGPSLPGMTRPLQQTAQLAIALLVLALAILALAAFHQAWAHPGGARLAPGCSPSLPSCRQRGEPGPA